MENLNIPTRLIEFAWETRPTLRRPSTSASAGYPSDWVILNAARQTNAAITLDGGTRTSVGFYISPPSNNLPTPGTEYVITVYATDSGSLNDTEIFTWTMPGQAHNFLTIQPETLYIGANDTISFTINMQNVGNISGAFPVTPTTPIQSWSFSSISDFNLAAGESDSQLVTLTTVDGIIGRVYPLEVSSPALNSYTQYAFAEIAITSPNAQALGLAAENVDACSADDDLSAAFEAVFNAFSVLEVACSGGECNAQQRDTLVEAANLVINTVNNDFPAWIPALPAAQWLPLPSRILCQASFPPYRL